MKKDKKDMEVARGGRADTRSHKDEERKRETGGGKGTAGSDATQ